MNARSCTILVGLTLFGCCGATSGGDGPSPRYTIGQTDGAWRFSRDGQPFHIKGAVGQQRLDLLRDCGGNAIRIRADRSALDQANAFGLAAMAGLPVRGERGGFDWDNADRVNEQKRSVLQRVQDLKDHPALMFWAVGNELDHIPSGRGYNPRLWSCLNDLAAEIRQIDPLHPVLTVVGTGGFERKIREIARDCPDMDVLGINAYGDLEAVTALARQNWPRPYVVAEWGPTGHWQVPKTEWRAPLEQTSTEKAQSIFDRYRRVIEGDRDHCLGSFVFYWAQKQETTHTWYGLFRDGAITESVNVMQYLWSGSWPSNRAPAVLELNLEGATDRRRVRVQPGQKCRARVACYDSDFDALAFAWDIRPEVVIPPNSYAGGLEKPARPIEGLIESGSGKQAEFRAPRDAGAYRLFVEVTDGHGNAGYANLPFLVQP